MTNICQSFAIKTAFYQFFDQRRKLGGTFPNKVVLTMYQVTGTKGWGGKALWVPNIKLPHDTMYYDVCEDNTEA